MRLGELLDGSVHIPARSAELEIEGLSCDSRETRPGDLFIALPGEAVDGHEFAERAVAQGAIAVLGDRPVSFARDLKVPYFKAENLRAVLGSLCHRFYGRVSDHLGLVGVTGTKGKTTTTWILESILKSCGKIPALFGTVENRTAARSFEAKNTTAGCLDLHRWLSEHREAGGTDAVVEVSSHAVAQKRIEGLSFDVGVFTNIAPEHLDYHKTFEQYLDTKAEFFELLRPDAFAVISRDDPNSNVIAKRTTASIVWYGSEPQDGVEELRIAPEGLSFVWKGHRVQSRLLGYHNVLNLLGAMSAAECLGIDCAQIAEAASAAVAPPGRLEDVALDKSFRVVVDYAHTDGALAAVLEALRPVTTGRLITIFGCGGDRDRTKRPRMGRVAESGSDQLIITSDNPRSESPEQILDDIRDGLEHPDQAEFISDRREAIALGVRMAKQGDTVLIAGKGHETYQEFAAETIDFDDRSVAREFLSESLFDPAI